MRILPHTSLRSVIFAASVPARRQCFLFSHGEWHPIFVRPSISASSVWKSGRSSRSGSFHAMVRPFLIQIQWPVHDNLCLFNFRASAHFMHPQPQFTAHQLLPNPVVLGDTTGEVVNAPSRKRTRGPTSTRSSRKKARTDPPAPSAGPTITTMTTTHATPVAPRTGGVGPVPETAPSSTPLVPVPLQHTYGSLIRKPRKSAEVEASDVWNGVAVLEGTTCRPEDLDTILSQPRIRARPQNCTHVVCRYCA